MDKKMKHLEFIQSIVARMNSNSFLIKSWAITLMAAVFAISTSQKDIFISFLNYFILPAFWVLDGYYLAQERKYIKLYNDVVQKSEADIDFSLDTSSYKNNRESWLGSIFSKTLFSFYLVLILLTIIILFLTNG